MPLVGHPYTNKHINDTTSKVNDILVENRDNIAFLDMSNVKITGNMDIDDEKLYNDIRSGKTLFLLAIGGKGTQIDGGMSIFPNAERDKCQKKLYNATTEKEEIEAQLQKAQGWNSFYWWVICIMAIVITIFAGYEYLNAN